MWRPVLRLPALVDDQRSRARRQHLKTLQELDDRVLLERAQRLEREARRPGFPVVRVDRLPSVVNCPWWKNGGSFAVPHSFRVRNFRLPAKNPGEPAG